MDVLVDEGLFDAILITLAEEGGTTPQSEICAILQDLYPDEFTSDALEAVINQMISDGHLTRTKGGRLSLATG